MVEIVLGYLKKMLTSFAFYKVAGKYILSYP